MHLKAREIRAAMTANCINGDKLLDYVNERAGLNISVNYLNRIIAGKRTNRKVEEVICGLFGAWVEGQREMEQKIGGIMIPEADINELVKRGE